jgi:putative oxidoreductase
LILRIAVGIVFAAHGGQKLFMMGFDGVAGFFGSLGVPLPMVAAIGVTLVELVGGIALIVGVGTRYVAGLLALDMLVALFMVHLPNGIFVSEGGYELVLVLAAAALFFALGGPGVWSVDSRLRGSAAA